LQGLLTGLALYAVGAWTLHSEDTTLPPSPALDNPSPAGPGLFGLGLGTLSSVLTEEQRASFRQALAAQRDKMRQSQIKLREARRQMIELSLSGTFDEGAVRQQALLMAALQAELAVARTKALSQIQPRLSPEQIERIKQGLAAPRQGEAGGVERRHSLTSPQRDANDLPPKP
jgi:Spy/CpxP family protein refolding chaperone